MLKAPAFMFYPRDFLHGVRKFDTTEIGACIVLLCEQWDRGYIENDPKTLKKLTGISPNKMRNVLEKFQEYEPGKLQNRRLEMEREKQFKFQQAKSEAGIKGNQKRWKNKDDFQATEISQSDDLANHKTVANDRFAFAYANAHFSSSKEEEKKINKEKKAAHYIPHWLWDDIRRHFEDNYRQDATEDFIRHFKTLTWQEDDPREVWKSHADRWMHDHPFVQTGIKLSF